MSLAILQTRLNALNEALASGVRSVTLGEQTVTYNTTASLKEARNDVLAQIAALNAQSNPRIRQTYAYQSGRGYD